MLVDDFFVAFVSVNENVVVFANGYYNCPLDLKSDKTTR